ncbi:MAG: hypothetical protein DHS20C19_21560 [Acidimicrobiales bacterium]|nr:MAG: hypothetical protein DHS20C19_21560 [Acidimicrobiales bacterium]
MTTTVVTVLVVLAAACGGDESPDATPESTTTTAASSVPETTAAPETTTTTTTVAPTTTVPETTTTAAPVPDPPSIANPDRPWLVELRDDLIDRTGLNIEAANCIVDRLELEGFDMRLLLWTDGGSPFELGIVLGFCGSTITGAFDLPPETRSGSDDYGDDAALDRLYDWCEAGDDAACDQLWWDSEPDTAYESFAESCGGRGGTNTDCVTSAGTANYGDSPLLDLYYDSCTDGYGLSCDALHDVDEAGAGYRNFGLTCGERIPLADDPDCTEVIAGLA